MVDTAAKNSNIGMRHERNGDLQKAIHHYDACKATNIKECVEYQWAKEYEKHMNLAKEYVKDPESLALIEQT